LREVALARAVQRGFIEKDLAVFEDLEALFVWQVEGRILFDCSGKAQPQVALGLHGFGGENVEK
jgi:hypothetical protein